LTATVNTTPHYPVAVLCDDDVPIICHCHGDIMRHIEPQDVPACRLIDSSGAVFQIRIQRHEGSRLAARLFSSIGAPERYEFVPLEDHRIPAEKLAQIVSSLVAASASQRGTGT
jgi:hypothetical protein